MSVPTWKRKLSSAEFIYQTYRLNLRLGEILINKPKKYKANYTDHIIKTALSALNHLQIADSIFLSKYSSELDFKIRRENLLLARGEIEGIATDCYIFLEIVRKHDYASQKVDDEKSSKIFDQELEIGEMCESCYNLIKGVITHDNEIYKSYIKPNVNS